MPSVDFRKKDKELYNPGTEPSLITVPAMKFIMVDGKGDPNTEGGEYSKAVELLYGLSYGIKMSPKSGTAPEGYFEYSVPPLEGLWWNSDDSMDFTDKSKFVWTAMIRQPEFVDEKLFDLICADLLKKKKIDVSKARLVTWEEGLCVQVMHIGSYDHENQSIGKIVSFVKDSGLFEDIGETRRHHEIYLSDPRKASPDKWKTIIRHRVRK